MGTTCAVSLRASLPPCPGSRGGPHPPHARVRPCGCWGSPAGGPWGSQAKSREAVALFLNLYFAGSVVLWVVGGGNFPRASPG